MRTTGPGMLAVALTVGVTLPALWAWTENQPPQADQMQAMMEKAKRFTEPGEHHKNLQRFIGKWTTETRFSMGGQSSPAEKGTMECSWLIDGRWLKFDTRGSMMGRPFQSFMIMGYDNFKMSFVTTSVNTMDTAMTTSEGDMTHDGKALITYGTLDEYLTGEHDKMVKYVWRIAGDDKLILEVHDLPIGEQNTKVVEFTFTRAK